MTTSCQDARRIWRRTNSDFLRTRCEVHPRLPRNRRLAAHVARGVRRVRRVRGRAVEPGGAAVRRLTLYRDDSTVQVVYDRVKSVFWTAGNTVLVVSQFTKGKAHRYIH